MLVSSQHHPVLDKIYLGVKRDFEIRTCEVFFSSATGLPHCPTTCMVPPPLRCLSRAYLKMPTPKANKLKQSCRLPAPFQSPQLFSTAPLTTPTPLTLSWCYLHSNNSPRPFPHLCPGPLRRLNSWRHLYPRLSCRHHQP